MKNSDKCTHCLSGNGGTSEEQSDGNTLDHLIFHDNLVKLITIRGYYYKSLLCFIDKVVDEGFVAPFVRDFILFTLIAYREESDNEQYIETFSPEKYTQFYRTLFKQVIIYSHPQIANYISNPLDKNFESFNEYWKPVSFQTEELCMVPSVAPPENKEKYYYVSESCKTILKSMISFFLELHKVGLSVQSFHLGNLVFYRDGVKFSDLTIVKLKDKKDSFKLLLNLMENLIQSIYLKIPYPFDDLLSTIRNYIDCKDSYWEFLRFEDLLTNHYALVSLKNDLYRTAVNEMKRREDHKNGLSGNDILKKLLEGNTWDQPENHKQLVDLSIFDWYHNVFMHFIENAVDNYSAAPFARDIISSALNAHKEMFKHAEHCNCSTTTEWNKHFIKECHKLIIYSHPQVSSYLLKEQDKNVQSFGKYSQQIKKVELRSVPSVAEPGKEEKHFHLSESYKTILKSIISFFLELHKLGLSVQSMELGNLVFCRDQVKFEHLTIVELQDKKDSFKILLYIMESMINNDESIDFKIPYPFENLLSTLKNYTVCEDSYWEVFGLEDVLTNHYALVSSKNDILHNSFVRFINKGAVEGFVSPVAHDIISFTLSAHKERSELEVYDESLTSAQKNKTSQGWNKRYKEISLKVKISSHPQISSYLVKLQDENVQSFGEYSKHVKKVESLTVPSVAEPGKEENHFHLSESYKTILKSIISFFLELHKLGLSVQSLELANLVFCRDQVKFRDLNIVELQDKKDSFKILLYIMESMINNDESVDFKIPSPFENLLSTLKNYTVCKDSYRENFGLEDVLTNHYSLMSSKNDIHRNSFVRFINRGADEDFVSPVAHDIILSALSAHEEMSELEVYGESLTSAQKNKISPGWNKRNTEILLKVKISSHPQIASYLSKPEEKNFASFKDRVSFKTVELYNVPSSVQLENPSSAQLENRKKYYYVSKPCKSVLNSMVSFFLELHKVGLSVRNFELSHLVFCDDKVKFRGLEIVKLQDTKESFKLLHRVMDNLINNNNSDFRIPYLIEDLLLTIKTYADGSQEILRFEDLLTNHFALMSYDYSLWTIRKFFYKSYALDINKMERRDENWTKVFTDSKIDTGVVGECFNFENGNGVEYKNTNIDILRFCRNIEAHLDGYVIKCKGNCTSKDIFLNIMAFFDKELMSLLNHVVQSNNAHNFILG